MDPERAQTAPPPAGPPGDRRTGLRRTFAALAVRNFRLYFAGQAVSLVGTWMQSVAQGWLVLQLSHSGTVLGLVVAAQFLPVLLLGPYGGLIADRVNKRTLLLCTQTVLGTLALILGLLTLTHAVRLGWSSCWPPRSGRSTPPTTRPGRPLCTRWWVRSG